MTLMELLLFETANFRGRSDKLIRGRMRLKKVVL